ncbi:MAG TPA: amidase [Candidatus Saccharimonadales bacterium]|nr:amidase [Candidatus Saccharimonadales bacterium]
MSASRRAFLRRTLAGLIAAGGCPSFFPAPACASGATKAVKPFALDEITFAQLQAGLASGRFTARSLAKQYQSRIQALDRRGPALRSVIELNPDALQLAAALDEERRGRGPRGPLHGLPILVKDNIATHDRMMTTAGSLAMKGSLAPEDAFLVQRLRSAGAVLLGKTNLSEWANFRGSRSISGWSGRGGQTRNPYVLDRNPSGSSSGSAVAVAANLCAAAIGTETDGSIISPGSACGIVGLKPTVGLISRSGIIPISSSQDSAGPMTRTVTDAAVLLGILAGADPRDSATQAAAPHTHADYTAFLKPGGARGLRIGVLRKSFAGASRVEPIMERALAALKEAGAVLVDPVEIPRPKQLGEVEYEVMLYEFKAGLNAYLAGLGDRAPVRSLKELIAFNEEHAQEELRWFGQETLKQAEAKGPLTDAAYRDAVATCRKLGRDEGIDAVMDDKKLDAFFASPGGPSGVVDPLYGNRGTGGSTAPSAVAGYPVLTVPAGLVEELPVGVAFFGRAWSEPVLLQIGFSFEQATRQRRAPRFLESLEG